MSVVFDKKCCQELLQLLSWLSTVFQTFACAVRSPVVARATAATACSNISRPITPDALSVDPCFTLPQSSEVQCNGAASRGGVESRLVYADDELLGKILNMRSLEYL